MTDEPMIEELERLEAAGMVVAPWHDKTVIPERWVRWDQGELSEAERGPFRVWHFDRAEDAAAIAALLSELQAAREALTVIAKLGCIMTGGNNARCPGCIARQALETPGQVL